MRPSQGLSPGGLGRDAEEPEAPAGRARLLLLHELLLLRLPLQLQLNALALPAKQRAPLRCHHQARLRRA